MIKKGTGTSRRGISKRTNSVISSIGNSRRASNKAKAINKAKKADIIATAKAYDALILQEETDINKTIEYIKKHIAAK